MRILWVWLLVLALFATSASVVSQSSNTIGKSVAIFLTLRAVHDSVKAGTPVLVKIILKNISSQDIELARENRGRDSRLEVRETSGKLAPDTALGSIWNGHVANPSSPEVPFQDLEGNLVFGTLKPGGTDTREVDAAKFYEMTQPGKYTIQTQRRDPRNPSLIVKSHAIAVTVTP